MTGTLKKKLDVDFKKYIILGACIPKFAYKALQTEDKIGIHLPCNVVIEEHENKNIEISVINPIITIGSIDNEILKEIAEKVKRKLMLVIENTN